MATKYLRPMSWTSRLGYIVYNRLYAQAYELVWFRSQTATAV